MAETNNNTEDLFLALRATLNERAKTTGALMSQDEEIVRRIAKSGGNAAHYLAEAVLCFDPDDSDYDRRESWRNIAVTALAEIEEIGELDETDAKRIVEKFVVQRAWNDADQGGWLGVYRQAKSTFSKVTCIRTIENSSDSDEVTDTDHCHLGHVHSNAGKYEEALSEYLAALKLEPDDADLHASAARMLLHLGRQDEARQHWEKAHEIAPNDPSYPGWLRKCRGTKFRKQYFRDVVTDMFARMPLAIPSALGILVFIDGIIGAPTHLSLHLDAIVDATRSAWAFIFGWVFEAGGSSFPAWLADYVTMGTAMMLMHLNLMTRLDRDDDYTPFDYIRSLVILATWPYALVQDIIVVHRYRPPFDWKSVHALIDPFAYSAAWLLLLSLF